MQSQGERLELRGTTTLPQIASFLDAVAHACERQNIDPESQYAVRLATEEICLNALHHGYHDEAGPIEVILDINSQRIELTINDRATHFSPADSPTFDSSANNELRPIGGYGLHLVKSMMDKIEHTVLEGGGNRLKLTKTLPAPS